LPIDDGHLETSASAYHPKQQSGQPAAGNEELGIFGHTHSMASTRRTVQQTLTCETPCSMSYDCYFSYIYLKLRLIDVIQRRRCDHFRAV